MFTANEQSSFHNLTALPQHRLPTSWETAKITWQNDYLAKYIPHLFTTKILSCSLISISYFISRREENHYNTMTTNRRRIFLIFLRVTSKYIKWENTYQKWLFMAWNKKAFCQWHGKYEKELTRLQVMESSADINSRLAEVSLRV